MKDQLAGVTGQEQLLETTALQGFGTVKSLLVAPECLERLNFSAIFSSEAGKNSKLRAR